MCHLLDISLYSFCPIPFSVFFYTFNSPVKKTQVQPKLTLAVGSIIWDEDGHVVRRAVASQAGTVVAAICVVAGGVLPADLTGSYLTLIFIWKNSFFKVSI